jgi:hypothetical protein
MDRKEALDALRCRSITVAIIFFVERLGTPTVTIMVCQL